MNNQYKYLSELLGKDITCDNDIKEEDAFKIKEALKKAWKIRSFEIELYWKRALYFWGFIALAFVSLSEISKLESDAFPFIFHYKFVFLTLNSIVGTFLSFGWYLANRGSKYWQINWEEWIDCLEKYDYGSLYSNPVALSESDIGMFNAGRFSLSRINIIISLMITVVWFGLSALFAFHISNVHGICLSVITALSILLGASLFSQKVKSHHNNTNLS